MIIIGPVFILIGIPATYHVKLVVMVRVPLGVAVLPTARPRHSYLVGVSVGKVGATTTS